MERIVSQPFFELVLRDDGIVWLRRGSKPYQLLEDLHQAYDAFLTTVDDWLFDRRIKNGALGTRVKTPMAWLLDLRDAPTQRNDSRFEQAIADRRPDLKARSPLMVALVKTAAGKHQLGRMVRNADIPVQVSNDFDAAVAWLLKGLREVFGDSEKPSG